MSEIGDNSPIFSLYAEIVTFDQPDYFHKLKWGW